MCLLFCLLLAVICMVLSPITHHSNDRQRVAVVLALLSQDKHNVEQYLLSTAQSNRVRLTTVNALGVINGLDDVPIAFEQINIQTNGRIIARTSGLVMQLQLTPTLKNGVVTWACEGHPERIMPVACRGK